MANACYRLGFKYLARKKAYLTRKFANVNLEKLRIHCLLIEERTEWNVEKGMWVFKKDCPTGWMDEAYMLSGDFKNFSWVRPRQALRDLARGGYRRIVLIGALFTWALGSVSANVHWNSAWKQRPDRPFYGKCNAKMVHKYFEDRFFPVSTEIPEDIDGERILFCDNWSAHTRFREDFRGLSDAQVASWIADECNETSFSFPQCAGLRSSCHRTQ